MEAVPPLPEALQVEVTSACNLRCAMCLVRYRPPVNKIAGAMSLDTFRRLVDDLPGLRRLTLQGLGEPLLAPDLLEMVR
jgi:MoaA/NifB/PqqE/SkfB family radical SAM enzyme